MHQVDPLAPGQRIDATGGDEEVVALAEAFNEMLDRLEGERRDSGRRALAAQEAERRRIARELHDEIGQLLTGLVLRGETLARRAPERAARRRRRAPRGRPRGGGGGAADRPPAAPRGARRARAPERAAGVVHDASRRRADLEVERRLARDLPLTAEEELVIYRVAQESLTNVVRHARARRVTLTLEPTATAAWCSSCADDGVGLPARGGERLQRDPRHARASAARRRAAHRPRRRAARHRGRAAAAGAGRR